MTKTTFRNEQASKEPKPKQTWVAPVISEVGKVQDYVKALKRSGSADVDVLGGTVNRRPGL